VERKHNSGPQQYKQERRIHNLDKWTRPQERKSFKNKNKNNFEDEILKTKHFKQTILASVNKVGLQRGWWITTKIKNSIQ
jgi:hypothetical protein